MARIKKNDLVYVRSGNDKGKTGKVLEILTKHDMVLVEGVNLVWKHEKPSQKRQRGGRVQKLAPVHMSKVQPVDPKTGKGTRVKFEKRDDGLHRVASKSGSDLGMAK